MVLIAFWPVQKSENAMHLPGYTDSGTKQILQEKLRPAGMGIEESKFCDFSVPPGHMACMPNTSTKREKAIFNMTVKVKVIK